MKYQYHININTWESLQWSLRVFWLFLSVPWWVSSPSGLKWYSSLYTFSDTLDMCPPYGLTLAIPSLECSPQISAHLTPLPPIVLHYVSSFPCIFARATSPNIFYSLFLLYLLACMLSHFSHVWLFATLWAVDCQSLLSMGFSRQEYWSKLPCPPPGDHPDPGIESASPALAGGFFTTSATREAHLSPSVQFRSVAQSCLTLCDPMNRSTPGLPVHHQLLEFTQIHVHWVDDAIQPSHPLSSPSPPAPNPSQHQSLFPWVNSSHEVAKVLKFQL